MIRQATMDDYLDIKAIRSALGIDRSKLENNNYRFSLQKNGFLLFSDLDKSEFEKDLQKTYLVCEENNRILGYIRIDDEQEMRTESNAIWFRQDLQTTYYTHPHAGVGGIAVMPNTIHKGVGTALLSEAEKEVKKKNIPYLFSFVVFSPVTNIPSLLFHEKHGFERIAMTSYPELFDLRNYKSVLYGKSLL